MSWSEREWGDRQRKRERERERDGERRREKARERAKTTVKSTCTELALIAKHQLLHPLRLKVAKPYLNYLNRHGLLWRGPDGRAAEPLTAQPCTAALL